MPPIKLDTEKEIEISSAFLKVYSEISLQAPAESEIEIVPSLSEQQIEEARILFALFEDYLVDPEKVNQKKKAMPIKSEEREIESGALKAALERTEEFFKSTLISIAGGAFGEKLDKFRRWLATQSESNQGNLIISSSSIKKNVPASGKQRAIAFFIDLAVGLFLTLIVVLLVNFSYFAEFGSGLVSFTQRYILRNMSVDITEAMSEALIILIGHTIAFWPILTTFYLIFIMTQAGTTVGLVLTKTRITDFSGRVPSSSSYLIRVLCMPVSVILLSFINIFWGSRTLHDRYSGTVILKR
ncbi:MAG TPA: RDD family protein [Oligoflexia bacterium]|nr:RDD family protein [Oligoflexia bacterium]HMP26808.1 RDD family protein [Oligoflexia bacterium]